MAGEQVVSGLRPYRLSATTSAPVSHTGVSHKHRAFLHAQACCPEVTKEVARAFERNVFRGYEPANKLARDFG